MLILVFILRYFALLLWDIVTYYSAILVEV